MKEEKRAIWDIPDNPDNNNPPQKTRKVKAVAKAVIYTRFSPRPNADETTSEQKQIEICKAYCEKQKYEVIKVFSDRKKSGDDPDRLELWNAIGMLKRGMVLVVRWRSRLARDVYLGEIINRAVCKAGAVIEAAEENNGTSPQDELLRDIFAGLARFEKKVIASRTKRAMLKYQNQDHKIMSKRLPYGYQVDSANYGKMIECLAEKEVLRVMFELRRSGMSLRKIAIELDKRELHPREADKWDHRTIAKILKREG